MKIPEKIFDKITERAFKNISDADEERKESMRIILVYESTDEEDESVNVLVQSIELSPPPPMQAWAEIFNSIAKEIYGHVKRVPLYVGIISAINFLSRKDYTGDGENIEEFVDKSTSGYLVMVSDVENGACESKIYNTDLILVEDSTKKFSLFNPKHLREYPPSAMMLAFNARLILEHSVNNTIYKESVPSKDLINTQTTISMKRDREGKFKTYDSKTTKMESNEIDSDRSGQDEDDSSVARSLFSSN